MNQRLIGLLIALTGFYIIAVLQGALPSPVEILGSLFDQLVNTLADAVADELNPL